MIIVDHEEIIKIPSDLSGRFHRCVDVEFMPLRKWRENTWHHRRLNVPGCIQLGFDSLLRGCCELDPMDVMLHLPCQVDHIISQLTDLIT